MMTKWDDIEWMFFSMIVICVIVVILLLVALALPIDQRVVKYHCEHEVPSYIETYYKNAWGITNDKVTLRMTSEEIAEYCTFEGDFND